MLRWTPGYEQVPLVEKFYQFSIRGGILDIRLKQQSRG